MNKSNIKKEGVLKKIGATAGKMFSKARRNTRKHLSGPATDPTNTEIKPHQVDDDLPTDPEAVKARNSKIKLPSQLTTGTSVSNFKEFFYKSDK